MTELDTFDNGAVIEPTDATETDAGQESELDTFDSPTVLGGESKIEKTQEFTDKQTSNMEDQDDEPAQKEAPKKEDESKEDEKPDKQEEVSGEEEEKPESKPPGKTIRLKNEDGHSDINPDSTVKIKVNGKNEFVSVNDLMSNYSGKVAYDKKFDDLKTQNEDFEKRESVYKQEKGEISNHMQKVVGLIDKVITGEGDPMEALNYLVDFTGRDALTFNKHVMEYMSGEVQKLESLDEVEQELYWKNKEVQQYRNNQAAKAESDANAKTIMERESKVNQLRESHGVTEEQFIQSHTELSELGYSKEQITPEAIVDYSVNKPFFEKAENLTSEYQEDLSDDEMESLISTVAKTLRNYPKLSDEKALELSASSLGWEIEDEDEVFKDLNSRVQEPENKAKRSYQYGKNDGNTPESFDDF